MYLESISLNHSHPLNKQQLLEEINCIPFDNREVLIVIDDFTRPKTLITRMVVEYAISEVGEDKVAVVVASGLHRASSQTEIEGKIGPDLTKRLRLYHHSPLCNFPLNKEKYNIIAVGCIIPHTFTGLSGGPKIALPGLSNYEDVLAFHNASRKEASDIINSARKCIETYVNYSINFYGDPVRILVYSSGSDVEIFRNSIWEDYTVTLPDKTDVAVLIPYIKNIDFLQSMNAMMVFMDHTPVNDGGVICIWSDCPEGIGIHYAFQKPNGLKPVYFDDIFSKQYKNKQICFICPTISEQALQEYFHREIFNFPNIADFIQFINLRWGRAAKVALYNGADIMIGEIK